MDDLLMAVGSLRLRWRKEETSKQQKDQDKTSADMKLMEFVFRMGQSAAAGAPNASTPAGNSAAPPPVPRMLALQDDPARAQPHVQVGPALSGVPAA